MEQLKKELASGSLRGIYLFYGEERFLSRYYAARVRDALIPGSMAAMNLTVLWGKEAAAPNLISACETLPLGCGRRLVIARESGLFTDGRKSDTEELALYLPKLYETTVLLFCENAVDKRGKLFKRVSELGRAVEFGTQPEGELIKWLMNIFRKYGVACSPATADGMIKIAGRGMESLYNDAMKLAAFKNGRGELTPRDAVLLCTPGLEAGIFALVGAVGRKDAAEALRLYGRMIYNRESPIMILTMIARQIRLILQCRVLMDKKLTQGDIAAKLGVQGFIARDCCAQARGFDTNSLIYAFNECLEADFKIKSGGLEEKLAVELLIIRTARA